MKNERKEATFLFVPTFYRGKFATLLHFGYRALDRLILLGSSYLLFSAISHLTFIVSWTK